MRRQGRRLTAESSSLDSSPRMPRIAVLLLSLMLGAGCAVLVSCGSGDDSQDDGIPSEAARGMLNELNAAKAALAQGDCAKVADSAQDIQSAADNLPTTVAADVRTGLVEGAAHLAELASDPTQCQTTESTTTTEDTTSTKPTSTTATPTTTEETTTTTTTEEQEPPGNGPPETPAEPNNPPGGGSPGGTGGVGDGE